MNSASAGDYAPEPHLLAPGAAADAEHIPEPEAAPEADPHAEPEVEPQLDPDAWRREVATRLARYRTRRKPRAPRYPSLLLPFEAYTGVRSLANSDSGSNTGSDENNSFSDEETAANADTTIFENRADNVVSDPCEFDSSEREYGNEKQFEHPPARQPDVPPEFFAKIIEFPRSAAIPVVHTSTLADPIFDRPRIVEAPEIVPPAPALGGILIEPVQPELPDRNAGAESVIPSASIARRLLAAGVDMLILGAAFSIFAAIFLRFNPVLRVDPVRGPFALLAGLGGALAVVLWMAYQYLLIVVTGSTPGLRAARVRLANFDGSSVSRRTRRCRVLASFLSAFSAGLGYLWCFLDQDSLCWHDRITRTHVESVPPQQ
ncbi:MAG: RDD family protein [Terriglobales bacterium]